MQKDSEKRDKEKPEMRVFWNSKKQGTYNAGNNKRKREAKLKKTGGKVH